MVELTPRDGETLDAIAAGRVRVLQRQGGYRFNLDAVLLAGFALERREAERATQVVELGTGCGVVALQIAALRPAWHVRGIEVQPSLADLARRNAILNQLPVEIVEGDWRAQGAPGRVGDADIVVCNPPYFAPDRGLPCSDAEKDAARQEVHGTIEDAARSARRLVRSQGVVRFIYGVARFPELLLALHEAGLPIARLRMIHSKAQEPAYAVLTESVPDSRRPLIVDPPLVVHDPGGGYSAEVRALLTPGE